MAKLGLLAGSGDLPEKIIQACLKQDKLIHVIAFHNQTPQSFIQNLPETITHDWVHIGAVGEILKLLKQQDVTDIAFAGAMKRPSWSELKLDWVGLKWLKKIGWKSIQGDNGLLSSVVTLLESEGFKIIHISQILDNLLAPEGVLGKIQPTKEDWVDINRGIEVLKTLGPCDVGQSIIVQEGLVLGIEAIEGTEALIARCDLLRRSGKDGVLIKIAKPQQSRLVDLPTIGESTIKQALNLSGIAVQAEATQILNMIDTIEQANQAGVFIVGVKIES
jgi:DUF1009 family protein